MALATLKKPRIRISLKDGDGDGKKRKPGRPKKKTKSKEEAAEAAADEGNQGDDETTPAPKRKRKRAEKIDSTKKISRKRSKKSETAPTAEELKPSVSVGSPQPLPAAESMNGKGHGKKLAAKAAIPAGDDSAAIYLDVDLWKAERKALDGSFKAARAHFTKRGPWKLPSAIDDSNFRQIAKQTLNKMGR